MELKFKIVGWIEDSETSSNRTFMELKLAKMNLKLMNALSSNRTFMELK